MTAASTTVAELVVDARAMIGEGPLWDRKEGRLLWVDISGGVIHSYDPDRGVSEATVVGQPVGSLALRKDGGLVAALRDGFGFFQQGSRTHDDLVEVEKGRPANRMNDGKVDCRGRFWAGTMAVDHTPAQGSLYRLQRSDGGYDVSAMVRGVTVANGLDWSSDNRRLYYIDSATQRIDVFDFDAERGTLSRRRPFVEIAASEGLPDGMTVDAEDCIWVALFRAGKLRRYSPRAEISMEVNVPVSLVTSCAFGGTNLDELYVTTARHRLSPAEAADQPKAGGLFVCRPGPVGRPPFLFG